MKTEQAMAFKYIYKRVDMDSALEMNDECTSSHRPSMYKIIIFLLSVIIVCLLIALIIVEVKWPSTQKDQLTCRTPDCMATSAYILSMMNLSVDPCVDMYQYACGGWIDKAVLPPDRGIWDMFAELSERNMETLRQLLESSSIEFKGRNSSAIFKLKTFYRTCMDEKTIENRGIAPVLRLISKLGSWTVTSQGLEKWDDKTWTLQKSLADMHNMDRTSLFHFSIKKDMMNASRNIISFYQSGLTLLHSSEYGGTSKFKQPFLTFATKVGIKLGGNETEVIKKMTEVFEFEKKLAKITVPKENLTNPFKIYNRRTLKEFQSILGPWIDIKKYLSDTFHGRTFTDTDEINIQTLSYFENLQTVIENTKKEVLANYMMWNMIQSMVGNFPDDFYKSSFELAKAEEGLRSLSDRWKRCLIKSKSALKFATAALFVEKTFSPVHKTKVTDILNALKYQFINHLDTVPWLDKATREILKDKANYISLKVGYPDWILNPIKLDERYDKLQFTNDDFLTNVLRSVEHELNMTLDVYEKPPDLKSWNSFSGAVNAYYELLTNYVIVPAGILRKPFYSPELPDIWTFATIGTIIGHELTHAFDNKGRYYDKFGSLKNIWTQTSDTGFEAETQCMVKQYSNYMTQGKNLNGKLTLGENIADNAGLKLAYRAYKASASNSKQILPFLRLTDDQLFFLGFSQIWCSRSTPETDIMNLLSSKHAPKALRVLGAISNNEDFSRAFKCGVNSPMNPKNKCQVW